MLRRLCHFVPLAQIAQAIWSGDALFGTDGSVSSDHGTYAFVILINLNDKEPLLAATLGCHMPDNAKLLDMDSHRPEAAALYAALIFTRKLLEEHPCPTPIINPPSIQYVLDNKSVMQDLDWEFSLSSSVFDFLKADYNIQQGIYSTIAKLPISPQIGWVKGHQDTSFLGIISLLKRKLTATPTASAPSPTLSAPFQ